MRTRSWRRTQNKRIIKKRKRIVENLKGFDKFSIYINPGFMRKCNYRCKFYKTVRNTKRPSVLKGEEDEYFNAQRNERSL